MRETVVVIDGLSERSDALREGLSQRWLVLEPELADFGARSGDRAADAIAGLAPGRYGMVGISAGAATAVRNALQSPERVTALVLVSPLIARPSTGRGDAELESRLSEIRCPTLVVFGQQDPLVGADAARIYRERIPNCNVAFVYDAGHDVPAERPQALLNLVNDYLERRETFIVQNRSSAINP